MKVALVVMPFAASDRPSLAVGLFQAALRSRGIECDAKYFNVTLAQRLGLERYRQVAEQYSTAVFAGEWVFSQLYYRDSGRAFSRWETYEAEVLDDPEWGLREAWRPTVRELLVLAPELVSHALESTDWGRYDLVGFTSTFEQTFASLCLARAIRERHPHVRLAAGGAKFESSMGRVYMERFPFLDFVCAGEGDVAFPRLCENLRDGRSDVPDGLLHREGDRVLPEADPRPAGFTDLDQLPIPDYDDFFRAFEAAFPRPRPPAVLPIEASRGCWWGEVSHCTFCGLNGEGMAYRKKSWRRVAQETDALTRRYRPAAIQFTDNILDMRAFRDLLPHWARSGGGTRKFFEVKSNLSRAQVGLLAKAGVAEVQAGVESLADGTLRVMGKGVTGAQNVALLRWCKEHGITAQWNIIFGFPKEDPADYALNLSVAEKLTHLQPPTGCCAIRLDRFSPNHARWREQGFSAIGPMRGYRHLFPFPDEDIERLAYFFGGEHAHSDRIPALAEPLYGLWERWRDKAREDGCGTLAVRPHIQGGYVLVDRRFNRTPSSLRLRDLHLGFLLACDAPASPARARETVASAFPGTSEEDREDALSTLTDREAVARIGASLVTLALLPLDLHVNGLGRAHSERSNASHGTRDEVPDHRRRGDGSDRPHPPGG